MCDFILTYEHAYREAVRAKLISSGVIGNDAYVVLGKPLPNWLHWYRLITANTQLALRIPTLIMLPLGKSMEYSDMKARLRSMAHVSFMFQENSRAHLSQCFD